ncbi:hypothetical protein FKP32DRAFT_1616176 [Trametes sanguinea]|nr:hypothetical protein FKP32DRAFT_1616176 [Trametes sanguinea]
MPSQAPPETLPQDTESKQCPSTPRNPDWGPKCDLQQSNAQGAPLTAQSPARSGPSSGTGTDRPATTPVPGTPFATPPTTPAGPGNSQTPTLPAPTSQPPQASQLLRSTKFWYPDGNVIIHVRGTLYKLYRARLAQHCGFFVHQFKRDLKSSSGREQYEGCPIYDAPRDVCPSDFERLMAVIDTPLAYHNVQPTRNEAISLLCTSTALSCKPVLAMAKKRLCSIWNAREPPKPHGATYIESLFSPPATPESLPGASEDDERTFKDTIYVVVLARLYDIPGLLKPAFYELITRTEFWSALYEDREHIKLLEKDLLAMVHARDTLRQWWREFVLVAPALQQGKTDGLRVHPCTCFHLTQHPDAHHEWRLMMFDSGVTEEGASDPLRYNVLAALKSHKAKKAWCIWCLEGWERALVKKREEWWVALDGLLRL